MDTSDERWEFKVGVRAAGEDGSIGHLKQVILNPGDGRVSALVVVRLALPNKREDIAFDMSQEMAAAGNR
jgi:hypothetical protein